MYGRQPGKREWTGTSISELPQTSIQLPQLI